jgi:pimeloyl-ACP methyl ester carboxylesterase
MIEHRFFAGTPDGVRIHVAEQGPKDGKPVVFLHGFPEGWFSWRAQMKALADAGFRAIAPDLRGYGESDKPHGIDMYKASRIADDVAALIESLGAGPVPVVGHDWGAPITYRLAMDHPELVSRLVILNGPHPTHFLKEVLRKSAAQRRRSWYIAFFQLPLIPERFLLRKGSMHKIFRGAVSDEAVREYEEAFARPYAATAALNFYRATRRKDRPPREPVIDKDVLIIWGMRDIALGPECLEGLGKYLPRHRIERLPDVGHFIQQEAPGDVSAILLRELRGPARMAAS